jgi:dolichol-phosphate mannosyltransferase
MPDSPPRPTSSDRAAPRVVCTLPTYNEAGNVLELSRELLALGPNFEVLVMDDDSPDGTWRLVQEASESEPRLHLLHRTTDRGRGRAGRDGFVKALEMGADVVVEMDADFSHQPRYIPPMMAKLEESESIGLVLGSRGVSGGHDAERTWLRRLLTVAANTYIRVVLGISVRDCNSGFRAWRRSTLERIHVEDTFSPGPAIVQELLFKTARAGIGIAEVPIEFKNRAEGESTLTLRTLLNGYLVVLKLRWMAMRGRL